MARLKDLDCSIQLDIVMFSGFELGLGVMQTLSEFIGNTLALLDQLRLDLKLNLLVLKSWQFIAGVLDLLLSVPEPLLQVGYDFIRFWDSFLFAFKLWFDVLEGKNIFVSLFKLIGNYL